MFYYLIVFICAIPIFIMFPTKIIGKKHIPKKGKALLCGNHQSNLDVVLFAVHFRRQRFLAKIELAKNFISRWFLGAMGAIFVNRAKPGIEAYKKVCAHLNKGGVMTIFPEGTRHITKDESLAMKNGAVMFALKCDSPIVPIAIIRRSKLFRRNIIVVGEAFKFDKVPKITKEVLETNSKILSDKIIQIRNDYLEKHPKLKAKVKLED